MRVKKQFNKYAKLYPNRSIIQQKGAEILVNSLPKSLGKVIDLGCGNGRLLQLLKKEQYSFEKFYGVDFADSMLALHPKEENIELMLGDFNKAATFQKLQILGANTLLSASALQWAKDINFTFASCAQTAPFAAFFLFSSDTFKTIHQIAKVHSPIHSYQHLEAAFIKNYRPLKIEQFHFKLPFNSTHKMLRYIQESGVSGNLMLPYKTLKRILQNYPYDYLEFEAGLFIGEQL